MKPMTELEGNPIAFVEDLTIPTREGPRRFGDVMQPYQGEWLAGIAPDLLALARGEPPPAARHWIEGTKGTSKTTLIAAGVLYLSIFARRPLVMQAGAVDRDNAAELVKAARAIVHENRWTEQAVDVQTWAIVGKQTGTDCEVVAADQKGSHGARPALVFIDECGHVPDERWEFVANMLDNAAKVASVVICATNAGWTETKAHDLRETVRQSPRWKFYQWAKPSPLMDLTEVEEAARRNTPGRQARLYWGVWGPKDQGDALPPEQLARTIVLRGPMECRTDLCSGFVAAVDLATKRDKSALVVLNFHASGKVKLARAQSWHPSDFPDRQIPAAVVQQAVMQAHYDFHLEAAIFDPAAGGYAMMQSLAWQGLRCEAFPFTPAAMNLMARSLLTAFAENRIELFDHRELIADLTALDLEETNFGWKLKAPRSVAGHHDLGVAFCIGLPFALGWCNEVGPDYWRRLPREVQERINPLFSWREQRRREGPQTLDALLRGGGSGTIAQVGGGGVRSFGPGQHQGDPAGVPLVETPGARAIDEY